MNKIKCESAEIREIIEHYGCDWRNLMLPDGVNFVNKDLGDIILPDDSELFQKIKDKSLALCTLPKGDYSGYSFKDVRLEACKFAKDSILPSDSELFQKIENKSLYYCELPKGDYSGYKFEGVDLRDCWFTEDSILPSDSELFQKFYNKSLYGCKLPNNTVNEIHLYNLDGVKIDLRFNSDTLTKSQHSLIRLKYPSQIGKNIKLPDYEDCVDDLHEEVTMVSEFNF